MGVKMFNRKSQLSNKAMLKAFPFEQLSNNENWFDRHPVISGGLVGALFAVMMYLGLVLR
jgi:hypothetical protein